MDQDPQWRDECDWPRRLLHVPSMISYIWQLGNKYGDATEPPYNAITYTWGRYELTPDSPYYPHGQSLRVDGIDWKEHMPRMKPGSLDPNSFNPQELAQVLMEATFSSKGQPVEFVWLDIACINQKRPRVAEYYSEIGRQARIFRGAKHVFVWLRSYSANEFCRQRAVLNGLLDQMWDAQFRFERDASAMNPDEWMASITELLGFLRGDVWFSSLWTLQEAFLSPNAKILFGNDLSDDSIPVQSKANDASEFWRLKDISLDWNLLRNGLRSFHMSKGFENRRDQLQSLIIEISKIGILDSVKGNDVTFYQADAGDSSKVGFRGNPLTLLMASHERKAWDENDEIYGIMQIFDLQLGKASPEHQEGQEYSLEDLRDQLGVELMRKYPITSQLIIQGPDCAPNKAWRVNNSIDLSEESHRFWKCIMLYSLDKTENGLQIDRRVTLKAARCNGILMAQFVGLVTPLKTFLAVTGNQFLQYSTCHIELDSRWRSALLRDIPVSETLLFDQCKAIDNMSQGEVMLLFLGRVYPPEAVIKGATPISHEAYDESIALILCRDRMSTDNVYRRLGILVCNFWHMKYWKTPGPVGTETIPDGWQYLDGIGQGWTQEEGYFG
ncbi:hypothetical protein F4806DRAFT_506372 [Annulohypoxylon nitens]|nr:hypothetical protein F4806DRAFT_506372 [Annulohypoxylon nitens]